MGRPVGFESMVLGNAITQGICAMVFAFAPTHKHVIGDRMHKRGMTKADSWEFLKGFVVRRLKLLNHLGCSVDCVSSKSN